MRFAWVKCETISRARYRNEPDAFPLGQASRSQRSPNSPRGGFSGKDQAKPGNERKALLGSPERHQSLGRPGSSLLLLDPGFRREDSGWSPLHAVR